MAQPQFPHSSGGRCAYLPGCPPAMHRRAAVPSFQRRPLRRGFLGGSPPFLRGRSSLIPAAAVAPARLNVSERTFYEPQFPHSSGGRCASVAPALETV